MELRDLTRAEEEVMHILWEIEPTFVKDILEYVFQNSIFLI